MPITYTDNGGGAANGSDLEFTFTFPVLQTEDVKVALNGVTQATTKYAVDTASNPTKITFNNTNVDSSVQETSGAPKSGVLVRIYRQTTVGKSTGDDDPKAVYAAGSSIRAVDLNSNTEQALYAIHELQNNPVLAEQIDTGAITSDKILDGTIATTDIADSAVTAAKLANSTIITTKLATGVVTTDKIAADAVNGTKIADDSIDSEHYVDGSIDTAHIADSQVTTAKLNDNAVTTAKIAADAVTGAKIADDQINSEHYVDGSIDTAHIADAQITTAKIVDANVTTAKIAADAVNGTKIADDSINSEHYVDGSIDTAHIGNSQVTTAKIADANITAAKIASNAVTTDKIQDGELTTLAGMQSTTASNLASSTALTATTAELNQLDGITLETSLTSSDTRIPTSKAVNDQILAVTNALGGFVAIANETSFPATNPDPSNNAGTVVSISEVSSNTAITVSNTGVATIANGAGTGNTVTITGFPTTLRNTSLAASSGLQVQTTTTSGNGSATPPREYTFHKQLASAADIAAISATVNSFSNRYRVSASAPTSSLDGGDLWYDTTNSKLMVYSSQNSAWEESSAIGNFFISTISSSSSTGGGSATANGTAYRFTISNAPPDAQQLLVSVDGVIQKPNAGSSQPSEGFVLVGNDIIFGSAPANGASIFVTVIGSTVGIGTPSNNTVTTAILQNGSVTTAKIVDANVTTAKIADDAVTAAKLANTSVTAGSYGSSSAIPAITVDAQGRITAASTSSIDSTSIANGTSNVSVAVNGNTTVQRSSVTRFTVNHTGVDVAGNITVSGTVDGVDIAALNTTVGNITTDVVSDTSPQLGGNLDAGGHSIIFDDNSKIKLGSNNDLEIYHDGSHSKIVNSTGELKVQGVAGQAITFRNSDDSANVAVFNIDAGTHLYYDSAHKFSTTSTGIKVVGNCLPNSNDSGQLGTSSVRWQELNISDVIDVSDSGKLRMGDSDDLQIYHDGSHSYIYDTGTGKLRLVTNSFRLLETDNSTNMIAADENGAVELYYDGSKKFETSSTGVSITGGAVATGNSAQFRAIESGGATVKIQCGGSEGYVGTVTNHRVSFMSNDTRRWTLENSGHFLPYANNTYDIGAASYRVRNIYTNDLHLSNEGSSNDVDGTWGDWTIQEGESDLFLKNNRSGKKYKFNLTEVS